MMETAQARILPSDHRQKRNVLLILKAAYLRQEKVKDGGKREELCRKAISLRVLILYYSIVYYCCSMNTKF
jgi:hypothetical protein